MKPLYLSRHIAALVAALLTPLPLLAEDDPKPVMEEIAAFPKQQVTGVAATKEGRVFVNFPFWSEDHTTSVAEVLPGGQLKPFPDEAWQAREGDPAKRWVCVQSVFVDDTGALWVLDPAAPLLDKVVKGGPKLIKFDLTTNQPVQTIMFDESIAPERSYLNDVRIDTKNQHAYLTESGVGSIVVVDLASGKSRRVLMAHPSTKAEPKVELVIDGIKPVDPKTGTTPTFHADGIALDAENGWLYYHALTGHTLYRIKTEDLRNAQLDEAALGKKVDKVKETPAPDGMLAGRDGTIYLTDIENNAITRYDGKLGGLKTVIKDERLQWPDSLSWGPDKWLYVTTSQIHRQPKFNGGVSKQTEPFRVYRVQLP